MKNHWIRRHNEKADNFMISLKGEQLLSDYDLLTKFLKYSENEAQQILAKNKKK